MHRKCQKAQEKKKKQQTQKPFSMCNCRMEVHQDLQNTKIKHSPWSSSHLDHRFQEWTTEKQKPPHKQKYVIHTQYVCPNLWHNRLGTLEHSVLGPFLCMLTE